MNSTDRKEKLQKIKEIIHRSKTIEEAVHNLCVADRIVTKSEGRRLWWQLKDK